MRSSEPTSTLVLGAAGFLGLNLVDALVARGITPLCGRRKRTNVIPLRSRKVPMIQADLEDLDSLVEAMAGIDTVFHAAGYYPKLSIDRDGAIELGCRQLKNALDAAHAAKVRRFIYVSSTATVAPAPSGVADDSSTFSEAPGYGVYHDLKWSMEKVALEEDRLQVLVACPGACLGPWDLRVGTSALMVGVARELNPPHPDGIVCPVDVRDVATGLVRLAEHDDPPRRVLFAAGNHSIHDLLCDLSKRYGVAPPPAPLSSEAAKELARREEEHCAENGGRPAISREIVDLIVHGTPIDAALAKSALDMRWRPLSETLDAFDEWARRMRIIPEEIPAQELTR